MLLTHLNPKIKRSDKLFYGQYSFCINLLLPYASTINLEFDLDRMEIVIELRRNLYKASSKSLREKRVPDENMYEELRRACRYFQTVRDKIKCTVAPNKLYIYTNNLTVLLELHKLNFNIEKITEISVNRPNGTICGKQPGFTIRAYFKDKHLSIEERTHLFNFIDDNSASINVSRALREFKTTRSINLSLIRNYYFIDFIDDKLPNILGLMVPGVIRKTMTIVKDYDK